MAKTEPSESETSGSSSSDEEPKTLENAATEYEKQRQSRIAENRARIEQLGLRNIANSLLGSTDSSSRQRKAKAKSKRFVKKEEDDDDDDDDYRPNDEKDDDNGADFSGSSEDFEEEGVFRRNSRSRSKKVKNRTPISGKQHSLKKDMNTPHYMDEYKDLLQAIALSLKDAGDISDPRHCGSSQGSTPQTVSIDEKGHDHYQEDNTRRRKRKPFSSRVQMTEDDLVIHFCQFDEVGKGSITFRDLRRMAATHDFTWTDKELADMIRCFDSDRDEKLTLEDFRNIVRRCNMLQAPENP